MAHATGAFFVPAPHGHKWPAQKQETCGAGARLASHAGVAGRGEGSELRRDRGKNWWGIIHMAFMLVYILYERGIATYSPTCDVGQAVRWALRSLEEAF